ncbi:MAG: FAD-binding oxidoreductase [Chloroflexia bacterium]|nr:FAD-binding oxidoreductase [Chloroflexia bacterium]
MNAQGNGKRRSNEVYDLRQELPSRADVVVIGGGVTGTAAAYQLSKRGKEVVLLEMRGVCSGASGRNAGQTGSGSSMFSRVGRAVYGLTRENLRLISEELPAELGDDFDLRLTGSVDIAQDEEMWNHLVETTAALQGLDTGVRMIDRYELQQLIPAASDALLGAKYAERAGHLWPFHLVHGQAGGARKLGAKIFPWTPATAILTGNGNVTGVETERGTIATDTVVVATNAWTPKLLEDLPAGALVPARGQILVTQPVDTVLPHAFGTNFDKEYGRQTATGQLICGGFRRFDRDEGLGHYTEEVVAGCMIGCAGCLSTLFPKIGPIRVVRAWAGIMGFTADGLPMIGPYDLAAGLFVSAGFNGGGFSWGPATGKAIAQLIAEGQTEFDLQPFDPNRFAGGGVSWDNPFTAGEKNNPRSVAEIQANA